MHIDNYPWPSDSAGKTPPFSPNVVPYKKEIPEPFETPDSAPRRLPAQFPSSIPDNSKVKLNKIKTIIEVFEVFNTDGAGDYKKLIEMIKKELE